jgi:Spy/CpxP family protein refolding chaperone
MAMSAVLASGLLVAQPPMRGQKGERADFRAGMFERLAARLELTEAQKQQAKSVFDAARQQAEPLREQLKQTHDALRDAVKTGKTEVEIDQLASRQGALMGQLTGIHTKAFARVYATLTPEQKQKADELRGGFQGMMHQQFRGRAH